MKLLGLAFDDDVKATLTIYRSGANISKRSQVETGEKRLALTEQNRPDD